jgi:cytochrome P450
VLPAIYLTHRHPDFWADPDRFDPDRFEASAVKARHRWAYLPFSLGARMCIGNQFSLVEAAIILSMLVQRADFALATHAPIKPQATITMRPAGPVPVKLTWRRDA